MSKNYTPSPWHVGGNGTIIYDAEGWGVANATVFHGRHPGAAGANACLIAAAPDLLEALEGVIRVADRATVEFDAARAAIAKATKGARHVKLTETPVDAKAIRAEVQEEALELARAIGGEFAEQFITIFEGLNK